MSISLFIPAFIVTKLRLRTAIFLHLLILTPTLIKIATHPLLSPPTHLHPPHVQAPLRLLHHPAPNLPPRLALPHPLKRLPPPPLSRHLHRDSRRPRRPYQPQQQLQHLHATRPHRRCFQCAIVLVAADYGHDYSSLIPHHDPDVHSMHRPRAVSAATRALSAQVHAHVLRGRVALTLGGDHSVGIGTVSGGGASGERGSVRRGERVGRVVWVDAHGVSCSGWRRGTGEEDVFGWIGREASSQSAEAGVYIGLRDLERGGEGPFRENGIKAYTMRDVERYGIGEVMEMALAWLGHDKPIHLSFDIDSLDPSFAPSTGFPVWEGLTLCEGNFIAETIAATGNLVGLDLVEINPTITPEGEDKTVRAGCSILRSALGETLL